MCLAPAIAVAVSSVSIILQLRCSMVDFLSISWMILVGDLTANKGGLRLTASFSFAILTKHLHLESFKAAGNASELVTIRLFFLASLV